ncbi:MAG: hypothetical protein HOV77_16745 [Hamadaea sp.]|uniref:hypothetical protein n=1 Tax=Hamadaea sp. TaxID=2024425 RepID=UPI00179D29BF|nr:hypothetical protein [Hamadaea sp.]NUT20830.1 hypothetical protein [Hamadaea sp.]
MDEQLARLREQHGEAADTAAQWNPAETATAGVDGPVAAVVSFDGAIRELQVHPDWQRRLAGDDFGAAVVSAVTAAHRTAIRQVMTRRTTHDKATTAGPAEAATTSADADPVAFASYLRSLLADVQSVLPEAEARAFHAAREERTETGADSAVVATAQAGRLVHVDVDLSWLRRADHKEAGRELTRVLRRLLPGGIVSAVTEMDAVGRVAEFRTLMADPSQLLANLGLADRSAP